MGNDGKIEMSTNNNNWTWEDVGAGRTSSPRSGSRTTRANNDPGGDG